MPAGAMFGSVNVLVVDAFPRRGAGVGHGPAIVEEAIATLEAASHTLTHRVLADGPFERFMSANERAAYHEAEPLITPETRSDAAAIKAADGVLFCYPTVLFTTPALLKGWMERVLVPGVAFVFDEAGRVRAGMTNVRRLGVITTSPHSAMSTARRRDAGRRTTIRNLRLSCHPRCRTTFVSLDPHGPSFGKVRTALGRW